VEQGIYNCKIAVCAFFWEDEVRNTFINGDGILFNISPPKLPVYTIQPGNLFACKPNSFAFIEEPIHLSLCSLHFSSMALFMPTD
jgi:hypothetical protein